MARRSSARVRNRNSSTPKRVSLSHDAPSIRTPRTVPAKLGCVEEGDEMPGAFPRSTSPPTPRASLTIPAKRMKAPASTGEAMPKTITPIKPSEEAVHPRTGHQTTSNPLDEARHLAMSNKGVFPEPPRQPSEFTTLLGTPTKSATADTIAQSPKCQFTFRREHSLELSPEAKMLMYAMREDAARIREQMVAGNEDAKEAPGSPRRKYATPKGKKGRFSDVHASHFQKMDSIVGHASSFRADPSRLKVVPLSMQQRHTTTPIQICTTTTVEKKALKRSPSQAQFDEVDTSALSGTPRHKPSKPTSIHTGSDVPRSQSFGDVIADAKNDTFSPAKRVKRVETDDVSTACAAPSDNRNSLPSTPQLQKTMHMQQSTPHVSSVGLATQASLARVASIKSAKGTKIPGPMLARSPSKQTMTQAYQDSAKTSSTLLTRSPSKLALFPEAKVGKLESSTLSPPLLARTPSKASPCKKSVDVEMAQVSAHSPHAPLLARSPLKMSAAKPTESSQGQEVVSTVPLLAQSPAKHAQIVSTDNAVQTPGKHVSNSIMSRFGLLRSSPMKSILRSPQRLYSNDPAKVAAGTHLATPPQHHDKGSLHTRLPASTSAHKHVDFTASTKAREDAAQHSTSRTPSKSPTPPARIETTDRGSSVNYPSLPQDDDARSPSPDKRRKTATPSDFTFRMGEHNIMFGQSPNAPRNAAGAKRPSTIRHVSAGADVMFAPATGSKKRKHEFENDGITSTEHGNLEDKENLEIDAAQGHDEQRPAKRARHAEQEETSWSPAKRTAAEEKKTSRLPTLGVKHKGPAGKKEISGKRPSTISRARLNELAMPKKRV